MQHKRLCALDSGARALESLLQCRYMVFAYQVPTALLISAALCLQV